MYIGSDPALESGKGAAVDVEGVGQQPLTSEEMEDDDMFPVCVCVYVCVCVSMYKYPFAV